MAKQFQILDRAIHVPYECAVCKTSGANENPVIDLEVQIDYYGMVYLCSFCVANIAHHFGYMNPKHAALLQEEVESLRARIDRVPAITERLVNDIRDLSIAATADLLSDPSDIVLVNDEKPEPVNEGASVDDTGTVETVEPRSEPVVDEGSVSVPASSSVKRPKTTPRNSAASNG